MQGKKKRDTAARDAAKIAEGEAAEALNLEADEGEGTENLLSSKDEDVIF